MNILMKDIIKNSNKMMSMRLISAVIAFLLLSVGSTYATHIVGGDISYKCLGSSEYEVTLTMRRDCANGEEPFDGTAFVGIFDGYGNLLPWLGTGGMLQLKNPVIDTINTDLDSGSCGFIGEQVCVEEATYTGIVSLPFRSSGYFLAYQRCCRNFTLSNVVDPLNTGATWFTRVTEEALQACNDSPKFNQWPDIYICANQSLVFDHSASESDGDSLVYSLCAPKHGATFDNPQPSPPAGPPYEDIVFVPPFNENDPMGGIPLNIDSKTGVITATPNAVGQFQIGICVEEYRDGVFLSRTIRDFEYNVRVCTEGPTAEFSAPDLICDGNLTVSFVNNSENADSYQWYFNYPSVDPAFVSFDENPTFEFPEYGTYIIALDAIRDLDGCTDTKFDTIGIFNSQLEADFDFEIVSCNPNTTNLQLTDLSTDPSFNVTKWEWTATTQSGFSATSNEQNPVINVPKDDNVNVTLVAYAENGCSATVSKNVDADPLDLELIPSPAMICEGDTTALLLDPNCDVLYTILPLTYTFKNDADPTDCNIYIVPQGDISYKIYASNGICFDSTSLDVEIIEFSDISLEGDEVVCDNTIDLNVVGGLDFNKFEWSFNEGFDPLIGDNSDKLSVAFPDADTVSVFVRIKEGTGCGNVVEKQVYNKTIDISYAAVDSICVGVEEELVITNNGIDDITITWEDNDIIIATTDSSAVVYTDVESNYTINFTVTNEFGCSESGQIDLHSETPPDNLNISSELQCGSFTVCFTTEADVDVLWDFGDPNTDTDVSTEKSPCYTYPSIGDYEVTLITTQGACSSLEVKETVTVPEVISISSPVTQFDICKGEKVIMEVNVNVDADVVWTIDGQEVATGNMYMDNFDNDAVVIATATDAFGCSDQAEFNIDVYDFDVTISGPAIVCEGEVVTLTATNNSPGTQFSYDWIPDELIISGDGTTTVEVSATEPTVFSVIVTDLDNNCVDTTDFELNVSVIDAELYADPEDPYQCTESEIGVLNPDSDWTFEWNNGVTDPVFVDTIMNDTTYTVTITDENNCTEVVSITVVPQLPNCDESDVFLPNAFSPNNDGVNDVFIVRSNFIKKIDFVVYNRWGEEMFKTQDQNVGWDGTYKGVELAPDVYAYSLHVVCSNGATYQKIGNVTLVR